MSSTWQVPWKAAAWTRSCLRAPSRRRRRRPWRWKRSKTKCDKCSKSLCPQAGKWLKWPTNEIEVWWKENNIGWFELREVLGIFGGFGQFSSLLLVFWMALISEALCTVFLHSLCVSWAGNLEQTLEKIKNKPDSAGSTSEARLGCSIAFSHQAFSVEVGQVGHGDSKGSQRSFFKPYSRVVFNCSWDFWPLKTYENEKMILWSKLQTACHLAV